MLIRGNGELGEVSEDSLDLCLLLMIIASSIIIGVAYTPPGMKSIIIPTTNGTHHGFFEVWAFWDSLLGIQV